MRYVAATIIAIAMLGVRPSAQAAQTGGPYHFTVRMFAGADGPALASPALSVLNGQAGTLDLSSDSYSLKIAITPSDAGVGRVALRVAVSTDRSGTQSTAEFDVIAGAGTVAPLVAVRDSAGKPIVLSDGRPLFIQIRSPR
jgi:hypothetical protein